MALDPMPPASPELELAMLRQANAGLMEENRRLQAELDNAMLVNATALEAVVQDFRKACRQRLDQSDALASANRRLNDFRQAAKEATDDASAWRAKAEKAEKELAEAKRLLALAEEHRDAARTSEELAQKSAFACKNARDAAQRHADEQVARCDALQDAIESLAPDGLPFQMVAKDEHGERYPVFGRVVCWSPYMVDKEKDDAGFREVSQFRYDEDAERGELTTVGFFITETDLCQREEKAAQDALGIEAILRTIGDALERPSWNGVLNVTTILRAIGRLQERVARAEEERAFERDRADQMDKWRHAANAKLSAMHRRAQQAEKRYHKIGRLAAFEHRRYGRMKDIVRLAWDALPESIRDEIVDRHPNGQEIYNTRDLEKGVKMLARERAGVIEKRRVAVPPAVVSLNVAPVLPHRTVPMPFIEYGTPAHRAGRVEVIEKSYGADLVVPTILSGLFNLSVSRETALELRDALWDHLKGQQSDLRTKYDRACADLMVAKAEVERYQKRSQELEERLAMIRNTVGP